MQQIEFSWKTKSGLNLYAKEWKPEGKVKAVVALVHGLGEHIGRYDHVAEAFGKAGFAMVGFDQRGHGRSEGIRGYETSYDAIMDDISQNIQNAKDVFQALASQGPYFFKRAPANSATAPSVVCAAFNPSEKSLSE